MGIGPLNRIDFATLPMDLSLQHETPQAARELIRAVKELNRSEFSTSGRQLIFSWDSAASRPTFRIIDRETGEVLEEIPPAAFRRMMEDLTKSARKK